MAIWLKIRNSENKWSMHATHDFIFLYSRIRFIWFFFMFFFLCIFSRYKFFYFFLTFFIVFMHKGFFLFNELYLWNWEELLKYTHEMATMLQVGLTWGTGQSYVGIYFKRQHWNGEQDSRLLLKKNIYKVMLCIIILIMLNKVDEPEKENKKQKKTYWIA